MIAWSEVFGLWYDVAFAEIGHALRNCPEDLWQANLWDVTSDPTHPPTPLDPDGNDHPLGAAVLSAFWKVAFHALASTEWNMAGRAATLQLSPPFSAIQQPFSESGMDNGTAKETLPATPPSRDDLLAYLGHVQELVVARLAAVRELDDGLRELGPWRGTTTTLLQHFHGTACHLVAHETELNMFVNQNRR